MLKKARWWVKFGALVMWSFSKASASSILVETPTDEAQVPQNRISIPKANDVGHPRPAAIPINMPQCVNLDIICPFPPKKVDSEPQEETCRIL